MRTMMTILIRGWEMPGKQDMRTPFSLFRRLEREFTPHGLFTLDAAASEANALCSRFYDGGERGNGLTHPWEPWTFCNPPFKDSKLWVSKAIAEHRDEGVCSVLVLPVGCSQKWFHQLLEYGPASIWYPTKRISFDDPDGKPTKGADRDTIIVAIGYEVSQKCNRLHVSFLY